MKKLLTLFLSLCFLIAKPQSLGVGAVTFSGYVNDFYVNFSGDLDLKFSFINDEPEVELKWNWFKVNYVKYQRVRYDDYNHPGGAADFGYLYEGIYAEVSLLEDVPTKGYTTLTKKIYDQGTVEYRFQVDKAAWQAMTMAERTSIKKQWKDRHYPGRLTLEDVGGQALRNIFYAIKTKQDGAGISKNKQDSIDKKAEEHIYLAEQALARNDYTSAIAYLTEAMNIDPSLNRLAEQIREIKETLDALQQATETEDLTTIDDSDAWDTDESGHAWDELESEEPNFDSEPFANDQHAVPDAKAFERQSRQDAGDLVKRPKRNDGQPQQASAEAEPNYSGGLCYSLTQRFARLYKTKYKLESQFTSNMERATRTGKVNQAQLEQMNKRMENVYHAIQKANEERYQALKDKRLSPDCHQDIQDLAAQYDDASINNMEQSIDRMQKNIPKASRYTLPNRR